MLSPVVAVPLILFAAFCIGLLGGMLIGGPVGGD